MERECYEPSYNGVRKKEVKEMLYNTKYMGDIFSTAAECLYNYDEIVKNHEMLKTHYDDLALRYKIAMELIKEDEQAYAKFDDECDRMYGK